ncbi:MAG: N-acetylmuramoyl-L-alanine amidase [Phaeodactylibacter sp.]|nr:N-acetylmuramoyl-L-alanine amidase [Phaeodactylibacter sp.]
MTSSGKKYHLLAELLSTLQAEGYPLGTGQQLQVQELLNKLPEDTTIEEMPFLLAPLFANNPKEQAHFYELFEQCRKRTEAFYREIEREEAIGPDRQERRYRGLIWLLALLLLIPPAVVIYQLTRPVERAFIEKPFQVQAGGQAEVCLSDSTDLKEFGLPESYEVLYSGRGNLGSFLVDTPQCLVYIAQDSIEGRDSVVVEWANAGGQKLAVVYKAIILAPMPDTTVAVDTFRVEEEILPPPQAHAFGLRSYPFHHDPLAFAVQPPSQLRRFLADNFSWLKWGGLLLFTALLLAVLFYRAHRRRKLIAELEANDKPPYAWNIRVEGAEAVHLGDDFSFLLNLIRQRTGSEAFRLDVPRTIGATIEQGGMPTFRFLQQTKPPEYLLLIDQQSPRNHRARLLDMLFRVFYANEVLIERFFYDSDPRVCYNELHPEGIPMTEIQQRYGSSRLIMVGYGNALLNKLTGKPEPWSRLLRNWKHRLLLTPRPVNSWGKRERRLGDIFTLLPLSMQSLLFWLEELEMEEDARFDTWPSRVKDAPKEPIEIKGSLIDSLQDHFRGPMLQWIAACAVYPSLHWDLTLYLGQQLSIGKENLLTVDNLLQLTRLPWFAEGRIPQASRVSLVSWLEAEHPALLEQVRTQLADILQQNPPPADSAAFEDYRMNVALNEWLTTKNKRRKRELEKEIGRMMEAGGEADITVIKQLQRERSPLDFIVPDAWKKYLHPHGLPGLGWRGEWRDVLRWALPLWIPALLITAWPWEIRPVDCNGALVEYRVEGEEHLLCVDNLDALGVMAEEHAKAAVEMDSLSGASAFNAQAMRWMNVADAPLAIPAASSGFEASWQWRKPATGSSLAYQLIEYNRADQTLNLSRTAGGRRFDFSDKWMDEYRSNMAIAFYNKGVELYLAGSEFFNLSPAERQAQLRDALEEWRKIQAGSSSLPPDVQQSMLRTMERLGLRDTLQLQRGELSEASLLSRFEQLVDQGRERVCAYFQEAIRLDSNQLDMNRIRNWCTGEVAAGADSIPPEACYVVANVPNELALRFRILTQAEVDGLNAAYGTEEWNKLRVNRQTLIKSIPPGEQVELLRQGSDFYYIRHKGVEGYIARTYQGKPTLTPCTARQNGKGAGEPAPTQAELQKILVQAPEDWYSLKQKANFNLNPEAAGTIIPEVGVRGRYAILKPLLNPAILEKIFGEKVFRSGPHRGAELNYRSDESFGRYNPAFLRKLYSTLSTLSRSELITGQVQGLYDREFRKVLRTFYQAYEVGANREDIQKEYLSRMENPAQGLTRGGSMNFFEEQFSDFSTNPPYYDPEAVMAAGFWLRRSIDGTADEFYQLLQLTLRTFDPAFLAPVAASDSPLVAKPTSPTDIQTTAPKTHTPRYLWCLDNPHGSDTPGKRSPVFDDGKTQLFEYQLSRDVVDRIIRQLEEIGVEYYRVAPEEEDIGLPERARRINNYDTRLPKLAVSVHFNAGPAKNASEWTNEGVRGVEGWYQSGSSESERLSAIFAEKIIKKTGLRNRYLESKTEGEFYILREFTPPTTLMQNGFYNNRADAALLAQPAFRQRLADAYVEAILEIERYGLEKAPAPLIDERDSDGDGVGNDGDLCPFTAGPAGNKGCPEEKKPPSSEPLPQPPNKGEEFPEQGPSKSDKRPYRTIQIEAGGPTWLAENLDIEVEGSWCYQNKPENCEQYGRLYTWEAAQEACRQLGEGWRLPTDGEWKALREKYGVKTIAYVVLMQGGSSGFDARLGGYRDTRGAYLHLGEDGYYWSGTERGRQNAEYHGFSSFYGRVHSFSFDKSLGLSCRCVKD